MSEIYSNLLDRDFRKRSRVADIVGVGSRAPWICTISILPSVNLRVNTSSLASNRENFLSSRSDVSACSSTSNTTAGTMPAVTFLLSGSEHYQC